MQAILAAMCVQDTRTGTGEKTIHHSGGGYFQDILFYKYSFVSDIGATTKKDRCPLQSDLLVWGERYLEVTGMVS